MNSKLLKLFPNSIVFQDGLDSLVALDKLGQSKII